MNNKKNCRVLTATKDVRIYSVAWATQSLKKAPFRGHAMNQSDRNWLVVWNMTFMTFLG
jgi:hypothetical protein